MDQEKSIKVSESNMPTKGEVFTLSCALRSIDCGREVNPTFASDIHSLLSKLKVMIADK